MCEATFSWVEPLIHLAWYYLCWLEHLLCFKEGFSSPTWRCQDQILSCRFPQQKSMLTSCIQKQVLYHWVVAPLKICNCCAICITAKSFPTLGFPFPGSTRCILMLQLVKGLRRRFSWSETIPPLLSSSLLLRSSPSFTPLLPWWSMSSCRTSTERTTKDL